MDRQQQLTSQFLANRHSLFAYIYGFVRNAHDAEDLFQEVWLRFAEAAQRGQAIEDPAKWSRGVARNLILHYWRDRKTDHQPVADEQLMALIDTAFAEQEGQHDYWLARQQALAECVQELPERSRQMLRLKYEQGLSAQGVAEKLAQSAAAVLMALSRVRNALRECAGKKLRLQGFKA